jgi:ATP-binding cassette, subfamily G (WHITE), eye pigment precursor transporter
MGASGAGKTTLLNVLNFRNQSKMIVEGEIKLNGHKAKWETITSCSGYVQQDDLFIGTMTVREHLTFLAMLKLGREVTKETKLARVEEIIKQVSLKKAENNQIGVPGIFKGISGGEKRRLAFASEILTNPTVLFCDEPTSGLDAFMAIGLTEIMRELANDGKTIICTIHQPSTQIFEKFDTLCLLSEGRVAYFGPRLEAVRFFSNLGFNCPSVYNPADYFIQTLAILPEDRNKYLIRSSVNRNKFINFKIYNL